MAACRAVCKLCNSYLVEKRKKTVTSVFAELSEIAADLCANERVSRSDIHQFLLKEPNYLCKGCHSTIRKYKELKPHLKKLQDQMLASLLPDPGQVL